MKTALRALMFAFAVILFSTAAYATAQPSSGGSAPAPSPTNAAPAIPPSASTGGGRHGPCKADVQNFCSTVQKGGHRILDCLKQHETQLSPPCEAAMKRHAAQDAAKNKTPSSPPSVGAPTVTPAPATK